MIVSIFLMLYEFLHHISSGKDYNDTWSFDYGLFSDFSYAVKGVLAKPMFWRKICICVTREAMNKLVSKDSSKNVVAALYIFFWVIQHELF